MRSEVQKHRKVNYFSFLQVILQKMTLKQNSKTFELNWLCVYSRTTDIQCTEVGRAFLIHFQKLFLNQLFLTIKIARELKFYTRMVTSGSKSVKKGQKMLKKATSWTYNAFSKKKFVLANLKYINS